MDMEVENVFEELMFVGEKPHKSYIPEVANDLKPKYGQKFNSLDDAYDCFNRYAFKAGFSIRKAREVKKNGEVNWKEFVCSKEGESDDRWRKKKEEEGKVEERERGETRKECPAKLTVSFEKPHYVVKSFIEEHSHPPVTPSKIHMLRSHRRVSTAKKNLVQTLSKVDIPIYKQFQVLETHAGGHENVGCTEKDLRNSVRDDRKEAKGHDVELLREHFKFEQEKDPDFFYQFHTDENQRLVRCFWADSNTRKAYSYFGDVVVFDTTYNTNVYKMIFAPIVGVNHHGQTAVFGCAFLNNETFDSFVWLLETWVSAMANDAPNAPIVIITDQDQAMTKAITHVLPNTIHRYCIWHILKKMPEKTSDNFMRDHYDQLKRLIWDSESPEEFENRWFDCLEKAQQLDNEWLKKMFDLRHRWIPAYVNKYFSAGMSSSQRVESAHAFFKHYCHKDNTLMDFVTRFNRALASQRNEELKADHKDLNETPILKLGMPMEIQMAKLYTNTRFMLFQTELYDCNGYMLIPIADEENLGVYNTYFPFCTLLHFVFSNFLLFQ